MLLSVSADDWPPQTWTGIAPVPTSQEFLDVVLSRTQRRLPTQIRSGFKITRIRSMLYSIYLFLLHRHRSVLTASTFIYRIKSKDGRSPPLCFLIFLFSLMT